MQIKISLIIQGACASSLAAESKVQWRMSQKKSSITAGAQNSFTSSAHSYIRASLQQFAWPHLSHCFVSFSLANSRACLLVRAVVGYTYMLYSMVSILLEDTTVRVPGPQTFFTKFDSRERLYAAECWQQCDCLMDRSAITALFWALQVIFQGNFAKKFL